MTKPTTMPVEKITIDPQYRRIHLGRLRELQQSIAHDGLQRPIPVTAGGHLIAGERRLRAYRNLGLADIPVIVADNDTHAVELLAAEHADAGPHRKPRSATELVLLGLRIEELEASGAAKRRAAAKRGEPSGDKRQSRDVAADTIGMSRHYYIQTKAIVAAWQGWETQPGGYDHTEVDTQWSDYSRTALNLIDRVHAGEQIDHETPAGRRSHLTVNAVYVQWLAERARRRDKTVKQNSYCTNGETATPVGHRAQRDALVKAIGSLNGLCNGLASITAIDPAVTKEEAAAWDRDLSNASQVLRSLRAKIKEHAHGNA